MVRSIFNNRASLFTGFWCCSTEESDNLDKYSKMSPKNKLKKPNEEESDSYDSDSSGADSEPYNGDEVRTI